MKRSVVAIVRCDSYELQEVGKAVESGIMLLGGIERFIQKTGEKLLLKPNVLWGVEPPNCVVTHLAVFEAVAAFFKKNGAYLLYGDSPAGISGSSGALKKAGFTEVANKLGIEQANFDKGSMVTFEKGVAGKKIFITNAINECDGVISLPKLKSHGLTRMTGAIKNQYGCVPGMTKGEYHARYPDVYDFSRLIVDITNLVAPRLYIMDAVEAMEGNGPQSGTPKKIGVLLFSTDPVAIDTVACKIINLDPAFVPTIQAGVDSGLGISSMENIDLVGDALEQCVDPEFDVVRQPPIRIPSNKILLEIRNHFIPRPVADSTLCIRCGRCVQACPVDPKAINLLKNDKRPSYRYSRCIRCFCCQEVCPAKAITIRSGLLKKLFPFASYISLFLANRIMRREKRKSAA